MHSRIVSALLGTALLAAAMPLQAQEVPSLGNPSEAGPLRAEDAQIDRSATITGKPALGITFLPSRFPGVTFPARGAWNWSGSGGLAMDITNPTDEAIQFGLRADDQMHADASHFRVWIGAIPPHATETFQCRLGPTAKSLGMDQLPGASGALVLDGSGGAAFDPSHVVSIKLYMRQPSGPKTLLVGNFRLAPAVSPGKIVDRFGQYAKADWPGKLKNAAEFAQRRAQEEQDLQAHPPPSAYDRFGGWKNGPQLKASGFFRTQQQGGRWWLVTPEGHLFFSVGMNTIELKTPTLITGRETLFEWLPDTNDPLASCYKQAYGHIYGTSAPSARVFDFYRANLERKYGADYIALWRQTSIERLRSWGFNTAPEMNDTGSYGNGKMPFTVRLMLKGDYARLSSGWSGHAKMHDPFDPEFAKSVANSLKDATTALRNDPLLIGYYIDNEPSWVASSEEEGHDGLAVNALAQPADSSPAKRAFIAMLKTKYTAIERLNSAWGTQFSNWDALNAPVKLPNPPSAGARADLSAFLHAFAQQYFRVIRDELKKLDPNHLYLGCRFNFHDFALEAVEASAEYCDVVSFNIYEPRIEPHKWAFLNRLNKPALLSEFNADAVDRGVFGHGQVTVPDQQARAAVFRDYILSALDQPAFIGCHWFRYVDEPITGAWYDGENYNCGFVDITDTPYAALVAGARSLARDLYTRRTARAMPDN